MFPMRRTKQISKFIILPRETVTDTVAINMYARPEPFIRIFRVEGNTNMLSNVVDKAILVSDKDIPFVNISLVLLLMSSVKARSK